MADGGRALVVGGGIAGLAAAIELATTGSDAGGRFDEVELWEADDRIGGKLRSSEFAGVANVDESADAYLLRVPHASSLAKTVGVHDVVHPTGASPAIWHDGLHDLPSGVVLGLPASVVPFATSRLLSVRGKLRAAAEPLLPRFEPDDTLGALVRRRFGREVHERLVDALVGSIYAADTDRWSLASVPQLDALASAHRSLLIGARRTRRRAGAAAEGPVFGAPADGMGALAACAAEHALGAGVTIRTSRPVHDLDAGDRGWRVDDEAFDAVTLATPAATTARLIGGVAPDAAAALAAVETADVIMVRMLVREWPDRLAGRSGYLVPKPSQRYVTAASFASQKWPHWNPPGGGQIVRVSLGRDGLDVMHLDDGQVTRAVVDEVGAHLDHDVQPTHLSITRWHSAFPQYRPHHHELVTSARRALPAGITLAGASYDGIGVPACIASGQHAALALLGSVRR